MKKFSKVFFLFLSSLYVFFTLSCKSLPVNLFEFAPAAVMSVSSNPGLPWHEENSASRNSSALNDEGILTGALNRAMNKDNPEFNSAQERIDFAASVLDSKLKEKGISLSDASVIKTDVTPKGFLDYMETSVRAEKYGFSEHLSTKTVKSLCEKNGVKSLLYFRFKFTKYRSFHNSKIYARAVMNVYALDSENRKIIDKSYTALSDSFVTSKGSSLYDQEKLVSLFPEAIEKTSDMFIKDFVPSLPETETVSPDSLY